MTADGTGYTFTVQICNYVYGNRNQVNEKDITYHLIVSLRAADGGELPENSGSVTVNQTEIGNTGQLTTEDTTLPGMQAFAAGKMTSCRSDQGDALHFHEPGSYLRSVDSIMEELNI